MNVKDVLEAMDAAEQLESVYDFLVTVLHDQEDIFYHGEGSRTVSDEIKQSVIVGLEKARDGARAAFKSHLAREIVTQEGEEE
tara:strand:+ start:230 stop:478 length:249 start_codon:yes stop_codon:yes gene_type:complete